MNRPRFQTPKRARPGLGLHRPIPKLALLTDPVVAARCAGLRHVSDDGPGIRRRRTASGFRFIGPDGRPVRDRGELRRLRSLAVPPAWRDVWYCPLPDGHIQATGRDARGRKQYRYHPRWREVRDETKYNRMVLFGRALPGLRARVEQDLALPGLPRDRVLATVVRLLELTLIRVGNEEYARQNHSYGLTTLRTEHVDISGATVRFAFRGKSGRKHAITVTDRNLARIVKRCRDLPGYELFQYVDDDGRRQHIDSADVNAYLKQVTGEEFTAKDFRTFAGTVLAAMALQELSAFDSQAQARHNIVQAIERVAKRLGNTPAICRKCYVHPGVLEAYADGSLRQLLQQRAGQELTREIAGLHPEEAAVLALLQEQLARPAAAER